MSVLKIKQKNVCRFCDYSEIKSFNLVDPNLIQSIFEQDDLIADKCKSFNETCDKCLKILISNANTNNNLSTTDRNYIEMPSRTVFMHLNEDILYDDYRFRRATDVYKDKSILIIGAGSVKRTSVLESIKYLPFKRKVNLIREQCWTKEYYDDFIYAEHEDTEKKEETLNAINNYMIAHNFKFDAILTYDELCVLMTAYVTTELGYPGIPYESAVNIRNKYNLRRRSLELGISTPGFYLVRSEKRQEQINEIDQFLSVERTNEEKQKLFFQFTNVKAPLVCKNPNGVSKDFIWKCNNLEDYRTCLIESIKFSKSVDILIEEYIDGLEMDADILIQNNKIVFNVISDNTQPDPPYLFEKGGFTPSLGIDEDEKRLIKEILSDWIKKLNIQNACLHFEGRCKARSGYDPKTYTNDDGTIDIKKFFLIIEINLRVGGSETWSMINTAYGVNMFTEVIDIALNLPLDEKSLLYKQDNPKYQCASFDYHPAKDVYLRSMKVDFSNLKDDKNAVEIIVFRTVGEELGLHDYVGWVTTKTDYGCSKDEAKKVLEDVKKHVILDYKNLSS